jgi:hypothetical protein
VFYGLQAEAGSADQDLPILRVKNVKVAAVQTPLLVIKTIPLQENNLRTHIHTSDFWNNAAGLVFEYTAHYTLDNCRILRTSRSSGILLDNTAIFLRAATSDFYISDNIVQRYPTVVTKDVTPIRFPNYDNGNVVVDNQTTDATTLLAYRQGTAPDNTTVAKIVDPVDYSDIDPSWTSSVEPVWPTGTPFTQPIFVFQGNLTTEFETRLRTHDLVLSTQDGLRSMFFLRQLQLMLSRYGYYTYNGNNYLLVPDLISRKLPTTPGGDIPVRYLTVPVRLTGVDLSEYTDQGAMPTRYSDAIVAETYVVYEDILGTGGLYEGL